jgi:hypothetical protein
MPELMKDYIRFPSIDHFERMLYAVAYSSRVPAHIKFKQNHILIWRDYPNKFLRICFRHPIYSGIIQQFLRPNEIIHVFRPNAYYVLQQHLHRRQETQIVMINSRIVRVALDDPATLHRACQLLKEYLYYTTFTQSLEHHSRDRRSLTVDGLETIQGYY